MYTRRKVLLLLYSVHTTFKTLTIHSLIMFIIRVLLQCFYLHKILEYIVLHQNYFEYELVSDAFCLDVIIAILLYIILADATATRNDASICTIRCDSNLKMKKRHI